MPIPQDHDQWPLRDSRPGSPILQPPVMRRMSEESIRTEDCEGPIPDDAMVDVGLENDQNSNMGEAVCTDRAELIERIKRGESPTWAPNEALKQEYLRTNNGASPDIPAQLIRNKSPSTLSPAFEFKRMGRRTPSPEKEGLADPAEIQRPRSALHTGDFMEDAEKQRSILQNSPQPSRHHFYPVQSEPLGTSPPPPWPVPASSFHIFGTQNQFVPSERYPDLAGRRAGRSRAPSLTSFSSSSYVLKAPTTPLVQQSNNMDLDFSPRDRSLSPDKRNRRKTLPPHGFRTPYSYNDHAASSVSAHHQPSYRREGGSPYSHHPRRSLNSSYSLQASSSPQTPSFLRSRRTSYSSETSPLQRAHMVGSYEESILRGWMSTAPSKPLDFTAQIGVLGRGDCKPKCPAHVTVPFPAVFYSYNTGNGRNFMNDDPSPYVGHIDLQQHLKPAEHKDCPLRQGSEAEVESGAIDQNSEIDPLASRFEYRKIKKRRRPSPSSLPSGGSYRIPQQGQLQIIIKNPNKTAVKLFLVPYDLEGMEPGTKTFVRQRSYSADPVIDSPVPSKSLSDPAMSERKPTLRYLIHLNICSPMKGRFYLYQQIRVVFANRVPDNKEQLRNEIQLPQPKYSAYRPNREALFVPGSSAGAKLTAEKAYRRRSSGFTFSVHDVDSQSTQTSASGTTFPFSSGPAVPPIPAIPFDLAVSHQKPSSENDNRGTESMDIDTSRPIPASGVQSPVGDKTTRIKGIQLSSSYRSNSSDGSSDGYNKLSKGESGYGGVFGRPGTPEPGEGLLARRLKGLGVQKDGKTFEEES